MDINEQEPDDNFAKIMDCLREGLTDEYWSRFLVLVEQELPEADATTPDQDWWTNVLHLPQDTRADAFGRALAKLLRD